MRTGRAVVVAAALVVVLGALPMTVAAFGTAPADVVSAGDTVTGSPDGTIDAAPGDTVTVRVWANATAVRGYQTNLTFDPGAVTVDGVSGSDDFEDPVANVNNDGGWVAFNQLRSAETDDPVLAEVTLTVSENATGATQLTFDESDTKLSDGDGEEASPESFDDVELAIGNGSSSQPPADNEDDDSDNNDDSDDSDNNDDDSSDNDNSNGNDDNDDNGNSGGSGSTGGGGGAIAPSEPSFSIVESSLNRTSVAPGDPVVVSATVENDGDEDGTFEGIVYGNGTAMGANTTVAVPEREDRRVNVTVRFDSPGVYAVSLNSTAVGNVSVRAANDTDDATANDTDDTTANDTDDTTANDTDDATANDTDDATANDTAATDDSSPGFGAASVAVSLSLLLGWLGYRRRTDNV
ncbi:cohesin domain-containing protein [Halorubrum sp. CSM-61]|uniref:cohesin domain-containing protein n=1 Tax=Halorubrum sp. CSM-61 TaxID=2485838 RepID=UPI000F4CD06A|nr:cohesin domain-containing protein [Halorubrum sp. CSM-61]